MTRFFGCARKYTFALTEPVRAFFGSKPGFPGLNGHGYQRNLSSAFIVWGGAVCQQPGGKHPVKRVSNRASRAKGAAFVQPGVASAPTSEETRCPAQPRAARRLRIRSFLLPFQNKTAFCFGDAGAGKATRSPRNPHSPREQIILFLINASPPKKNL